jgi:hypothetical protein
MIMPGLLDLPPELIEKIFIFTEDYVVEALLRAEQSWDVDQPQDTRKARAPVSRYTN